METAIVAWSSAARKNMMSIAKYAIQKKSVANFMRQVISQRDTRERPNSGVSTFKQILKDCVKRKCLMRWQ
nr:MAG TPA: hypothetical protein [Caudoviricetes sp.]